MRCGNCQGHGIKTSAEMLRHLDECYSRGWQEVINLRLSGQYDAADKKAKKLMGVRSDPMPEERKEYLAKYNEEHKEEIKDRKQLERTIQKRIKENLKSKNKTIKRKKG